MLKKDLKQLGLIIRNIIEPCKKGDPSPYLDFQCPG